MPGPLSMPNGKGGAGVLDTAEARKHASRGFSGKTARKHDKAKTKEASHVADR